MHGRSFQYPLDGCIIVPEGNTLGVRKHCVKSLLHVLVPLSDLLISNYL